MDDQLSFLLEEPPVSPSQSQALEKDWLIRVVTSPSTFLKFLTSSGPSGWSGRTLPASYRPGQMRREVSRPIQTEAPEPLDLEEMEETEQPTSEAGKQTILTPSPVVFGSSGMASPIESLTLNTSEWPKDAVVSLLSDTLEIGDLPRRFFLSARACQGILRRSEKNDKPLPPALKAVLEAVVDK